MTELHESMSTRDILLDILDRLERIETAQNEIIRDMSDIRAREDTNSRLLKGAWAVISLLVTSIVGLAFFVLQGTLRFPIPGVTG